MEAAMRDEHRVHENRQDRGHGMCRGDKAFGEVASPAIGVPLDLTEPEPATSYAPPALVASTIVARCGCGRADGDEIGGLWPRDTFDVIGPFPCRRCALVRHHGGQAIICLPATASPRDATAIRCRAADALGLSHENISVISQLHRALPR